MKGNKSHTCGVATWRLAPQCCNWSTASNRILLLSLSNGFSGMESPVGSSGLGVFSVSLSDEGGVDGEDASSVVEDIMKVISDQTK